MNEILMKLIFNEEVSEREIADALYDVCDSVHSSCDSCCPVYKANASSAPVDKDGECICFKNGKKMLDFIKDGKVKHS